MKLSHSQKILHLIIVSTHIQRKRPQARFSLQLRPFCRKVLHSPLAELHSVIPDGKKGPEMVRGHLNTSHSTSERLYQHFRILGGLHTTTHSSEQTCSLCSSRKRSRSLKCRKAFRKMFNNELAGCCLFFSKQQLF